MLLLAEQLPDQHCSACLQVFRALEDLDNPDDEQAPLQAHDSASEDAGSDSDADCPGDISFRPERRQGQGFGSGRRGCMQVESSAHVPK